ncbi:uncharacterized protein PADG_07332 [Paracoccidioides brasiliensis Pb18]|uniref:MARVEL domain-containing protein n=1 Tax=Paracoccidioides brasiliensis (strain Pb18) TaxID=502780 RepID=C1GJ96_PARBD|nr:uncharacterized protein PADG_07332 [Paracoccidioides brasiliensis Pb18]EEH42512.1 hypothetical protein PADG_07332 [Paracoccidioides brasiliensis Pb18]
MKDFDTLFSPPTQLDRRRITLVTDCVVYTRFRKAYISISRARVIRQQISNKRVALLFRSIVERVSTTMPVISRMVSVVLRIGEIGFAAVVAGIIGHDVARTDNFPGFPLGRWIYALVVSGISMLLGLIWLIPFSASFVLWIADLIISCAWFSVFAVLVNWLNRRACGFIFDWGSITDGGVCDRWKAAEAFSFLSAILWLVSAIVGIWFTFRTRDRRPVAGDGYRTNRRFWGRRHAV